MLVQQHYEQSHVSTPQLKQQQSAPAGISIAASTTSSSSTNFSSPTEREEFRTNCLVKPPYSYSQLIILSMKESRHAKMTLQMIYDWIIENFSYFKKADPAWQITFKNSIRHNLSLNKCFKKIARQKDEPGKGGFWTLDPEFEKQLNESSSGSSAVLMRASSVNDPNDSCNAEAAPKAGGLFIFKRRRNTTNKKTTIKEANKAKSDDKNATKEITENFTSNCDENNNDIKNKNTFALQKCMSTGQDLKGKDNVEPSSSSSPSVSEAALNNKKLKTSNSCSSLIQFSQQQQQQQQNGSYFNNNNAKASTCSNCSNCNGNNQSMFNNGSNCLIDTRYEFIKYFKKSLLNKVKDFTD